MILNYVLNGTCKTAVSSNEDVKIIEKKNGNRFVVEVKALNDIVLISATADKPVSFTKTDLFFLNGYQSWTDTFEYHYSDKMLDNNSIPLYVKKKYALHKYGDSTFHKYNKNVLHGCDVAYLKGNETHFIGNLNYKTAYLFIEYHKKNNKLVLLSDLAKIPLKKNKSISAFDYIFNTDIKKGKKEYFSHFEKTKAKKIIGYTSWYNYYQDINEEKILNVLDTISKPFELFQIDDGFEPFVGDWLTVDKKKFPNGLKPIVDKIHSKKMKAGIWLAPFAVETNSDTFNNHKDWLCCDEKGNPVKVGGNWSFFYALDLSKPAAVNYVKETLKYYKDLGFDFFKLDFLYAATVTEHEGFSRAQFAQKAYELLRDELKGKLILGCGAVVSNCFGLFEYLRIGPDVSLKFDDVWYMRKLMRERLSTKVTLRNTMYRHFFDHNVFLNDPDVFLLRDDNIELNEKQREALTTINALFGSVLMTSDNPKTYDAHKQSLLTKAIDLFKNATVLSVTTGQNNITVTYNCHGTEETFVYNVKTGCLSYM